MPRILILAKNYPAKDKDFKETKVVHYFAREFVKMGHEVIVIHNYLLFPKLICFLGMKFQEFFKSLFGATVPFIYDSQKKNYQIDNVNIYRLPIKKFIPHGLINKKNVTIQFNDILNILKDDEFIPDIIVGHWWSPQLELISMLKKEFKSKTCMVVHNVPSLNKKNNYAPYFKEIDIWGFRSINLQADFYSTFGEVNRSFLCYSGIPSNFITGNKNKNFGKKTLSITFAGVLVSRKHPLSILKAVKILNENQIERVTFVGNGAEEKNIRCFIEKNNLQSKVSLLGFVPREQVSQILQETDVFVMISKDEAFGLVYLEAMGAGCLTIASRNEGMDGIINDNENGFLCKAGDENELASILKKILDMNAFERKKISDNAVNTAKENTDDLAAQRYIKNILQV